MKKRHKLIYRVREKSEVILGLEEDVGYEGGGEIPPTFRLTAFKNGTHSSVHSAGEGDRFHRSIPWDRLSALSLSSSSSSSCSPLLLPFALRLFQWQQTFCCKKRALGCAERRCRLFVFVCVCCVCFVLAFSNRALLWLLLFLQTVFSNFLNVLYVFVVELIIRAKVEGEDTEKLAMIFF